MQDILQYIIDAVMIGLFLYLYSNSRKVELELDRGNTMIITMLFAGLAAFSFLYDTGAMKWIHSGILILLAVLYKQLRSGFSPEGIVSMGSLLPYKKIDAVSFSKKDSTMYFTRGNRKTGIVLKPDAFDRVKEYVETHRKAM